MSLELDFEIMIIKYQNYFSFMHMIEFLIRLVSNS